MCMGNTKMPITLFSQLPVHPHVYGEHSSASTILSVITGSSPCVWGTRHRFPFRVTTRRFIPMCMGNTRYSARLNTANAVHPHMYGEHTVSRQSTHIAYGSSPCVWGTRNQDKLNPLHKRFIPMCMGNTDDEGRLFWDRKVHPHVYGEHG